MEGHNFNFEAMGRMRNASFNEDEIIGFLGIKEHMSVLDLGAGDGFFAKMFVNRGAEVTAVDRNSKYFEDMNDLGIATKKGDICTFDEGKYDLVFIANVLHDLDCHATLPSNLLKMVKNELAILEFKEDAPFGPPSDIRLRPEDVEGIFEPAGFKLVKQKELRYHYIMLFGR
ncbi:MAG: class I SAM-dependent methyltransferase [Candidatus Micrarchaeaceae archaeon]|jgi:2-polyprenyl-3-methyl-5-hydroxy-6-metoxy-1,4-benzoquinol methylase